ncbi:hypothetical protein ASG52_16355 [Methylobacterium sp. Leaf456]|uniref:class I SAM-dependent methyltransferase n=1 Tax=Methylobacterium sp. Leaf456 TaxID=1736382 RepID=UPI00071494F3|nr:methyltransferase domain-containing protein [Methylobacterium sp. Leaf456]KQT60824.1 hypothetical protein ASG52_16355 [Methylobacterium sp. Leaf456]
MSATLRGQWRRLFRTRRRPPVSVGSIDAATPAFLRGWCVGGDRTPSPVDVFVNGAHLTRVASNDRREDLVAHGLPAEAGFVLLYPEPLALADVVEVRAADGRPLHDSPSTRHRDRLSRLLDGIDVARMSGLEIGPLDRPTLSKTRGPVAYVDHANAADLRRKYGGDRPDMVDQRRIREVDYVWPSGSLRTCIPDGRVFDYAVAVQVMEHVPDPIGWLGHLAEVIRPGGLIALALPERSRCFDHRRETTRPTDLIDAWLAKLDRPSPRQVFDHVAFTSYLHLGTAPPFPDPERLATALADARATAVDGYYRDVHCSVFTTEAFRFCWAAIDALDILPLELRAIHEPYPGGDEFIVSLRRR